MCIAAAPSVSCPVCDWTRARANTWPVLHRYYFLTSLSISPWWKKLVTTSQIAQFVFRWGRCSPFSVRSALRSHGLVATAVHLWPCADHLLHLQPSQELAWEPPICFPAACAACLLLVLTFASLVQLCHLHTLLVHALAV